MAECGADLDIQDINGDTPLHIACRGNLRMMVSMVAMDDREPVVATVLKSAPMGRL